MGGLRDRKKAATRAAVSAAALRLFAERGYRAVTMADVAAAAGVSERTLFRYGGDKDELLFVEDELFRAALADALAARPDDEPPPAALVGAAAVVLDGLAGRRDELRVRARVIDADPALRARERGKQAGFEDVLDAGLVARGVEPATARLLARVAVACYDEAVRSWVGDDEPASLAERFRADWQRLADALGGAPG